MSWAGQCHNNTLDGNPYVSRRSNLTVVAGASGSGIMKCDAIDRVVAALHLGMESAELFGGGSFEVAALGVEHRRVEPEALLL